MRKIAIYGKGGIGKSTITSSLSAAISLMGFKVMQIGCDPKADSTIKLTNGRPVVPVMNYLKDHIEYPTLDDIVVPGFNGILCVEAGAPRRVLAAGGRGIITTFNVLEELNAFETYQPDFVFYDVLGDVVCGGFAMPIRQGYAEEVIIITSGEKMALFSARNIKAALDNFADRNYASLRGLILNRRNVPGEERTVRNFADEVGTTIIGDIPRDDHIGFYEELNKTVIEGDAELPVARIIMEIASQLLVEKEAEQ